LLGKPKLSIYWAASCGGCEIAVVNMNLKFLFVDVYFDLFFCPCLVDTKKKDVEALADGEIAVTLFNGAIRTEENEEMARLLRKKSKLLIAFGSCASEGCVPGLANLTPSSKAFLDEIYLHSPSVDNPNQTIPSGDGRLGVPRFYDKVKTLAEVVETDYFVPGCPPESDRIWEVVKALTQSDAQLPPKGSALGGGQSNVCNECKRVRDEKAINRLYRVFEIEPNPYRCLLDQGIICMGIATRDGCGALCPKVNMPCTGCYGAPEGVLDQGAKMVSALGSVIDIGDKTGLSESEINQRIDAILETIPDYVGTFYKYSLVDSLLNKIRR
jgi:F420-non-reducing hydrogenase small subunit